MSRLDVGKRRRLLRFRGLDEHCKNVASSRTIIENPFHDTDCLRRNNVCRCFLHSKRTLESHSFCLYGVHVCSLHPRHLCVGNFSRTAHLSLQRKTTAQGHRLGIFCLSHTPLSLYSRKSRPKSFFARRGGDFRYLYSSFHRRFGHNLSRRYVQGDKRKREIGGNFFRIRTFCSKIVEEFLPWKKISTRFIRFYSGS